MENSLTIVQTLEKALSLVNIAVYIAVVIIALNCVWRVEKQLDRFLKLIILAIALIPFRLVLGVLGLEQDPNWALAIRSLGFLAGLLLIVAFIDLLRVIKSMNQEK